MFREHEHAGPGVHRHAGTRPLHRAAQPRRAEAAAGPRGAEGRLLRVQGGADQEPRRAGQRRRHDGARSRARTTRSTHGDVVIAAITSCTNTSNPSVLVAAGLVARKARAQGLTPKPWVKTSLAPGSQVVTEYLNKSGLQPDLDALGFNLVGYGCTTCIGNSGPLDDAIADAIEDNNLVARRPCCRATATSRAACIPNVRANYLARPPLVVAYALLGTMTEDITTAPLGTGKDGKPVYLRDVWPTNEEIADVVAAEPDRASSSSSATARCSRGRSSGRRSQVDSRQRDLSAGTTAPPTCRTRPISRASRWSRSRSATSRARASWRCSATTITTDHISPAGSIRKTSPAGDYLLEHQVQQKDFNSYGARRGNHEVMMRGTFANIRIRNEMVTGRRRRHDQALPVGRADADLRRGDALQEGGRAAGGVRRQGIRHRARRATGRRRARCCSASRP